MKDDPKWRSRGALMLSLTVVLCVGAVAGATIGTSALGTRAQTVLDTTQVPVRIDWPSVNQTRPSGASRSTWMPVEQQRELLALIRDSIGQVGALDANAPRRVSEALGRTGWFDQPPVVRWTATGLEVDGRGRWRHPAAVVRHGGVEQLVSWGAMPMPLIYAEGESRQRFIVGGERIPENGALDRPWPGEDVAGGIRLLGHLRSRPCFEQIAGIDVSRYANDRRLEIVTTRGSRVVWGAPPNEWLPDEQPDSVKLERLDALYNDYGHIDAGVGHLEIYGPQVVLDRRALPDAPTP